MAGLLVLALVVVVEEKMSLPETKLAELVGTDPDSPIPVPGVVEPEPRRDHPYWCQWITVGLGLGAVPPEAGIGESPDAEESAYESEAVQPDVAQIAVKVASGWGETCYSGSAKVAVAVVAAAAEGNPRGTLAALAMVFVPEVDNLALDSHSPGDMLASGVAPAVEDGPGPVLVPAAVGVLPEQDMELHHRAGRRRSTEGDSDTSLGESMRAPGPGVCEHTAKAQHTRKHRPV